MSNSLFQPMAFVITVVLAIAMYLGPIAVLYGVFWLISLPLRRRERARLFLDVLETGLNDGHAPERVIVEASHSKDPIFGARFYLVAAYLEQGFSLPQALAKVPRLLPIEVAAMLRVGAELGDIRRVLPACRQCLQDALSQTRGAINYLAITVFVLLPAVPVLTLMISVFVLPKFEQIAVDMGGGELPLWSKAVFSLRNPFLLFEVVAMLILQFLTFCYIAGPRLRQAMGGMQPFGWMLDRILWALPWRRSRMQRDFAHMLALLLDAGVPEARALMLAAETTHNSLFIRRARLAVDELAQGVPLPQAVRNLDGHREFEWRLANAAQGNNGFVAALRGWFETLDAKAFQREQAAAQTFTTGVIIWNGLVVGAFVVAVFTFLTALIQTAALW